MSIISAGTSNTTTLVYTGDTTGNLAFQINGTTEAMRITSGGSVGIGTANPAFKLDMVGSSRFTGTTNSVYSKYTNTGSDFWVGIDNSAGTDFGTGTGYSRVVYSSGAYPLTFTTNDAERVRITSDGILSVGIISPYTGTKLSVKNSATNTYSATAFPSGRTLDLITNSANASDYSGIRFADSTNGRESFFGVVQESGGPGAFVWQNYTSAGYSEKMRIDSSGRVTMPYQPTFTASLTNGNTGTSGTIVYNSSDINVGGHYNTTNGRFTVPIAGVYMFSITGISVNTTTVEASIMVNGSGTYINARGGSNTNSTAAGYCGVIFISLAVNDYVSVRIEGGAAQYGFGNYTTFSGRLMN